MALISVIVTTYNWKQALAACLSCLLAQGDRNFEIIVADDGSAPDTGEMIARITRNSPVPIIHCFQENRGFRAAAIRNQAIARCHGDYLVFLDGDCLVLPHFVERHRRLARDGRFVAGNRVLMNSELSQQLLAEDSPLKLLTLGRLIRYRLRGKINGLATLVPIPFYPFRRVHSRQWKRARSCNLGVWKRDMVAVNGFDEVYAGWGYEDSDLVIRLLHHGIRRVEGRFALTVMHLWHSDQSRAQEHDNYERFLTRLKLQHFIRAEQGLSQHSPLTHA